MQWETIVVGLGAAVLTGGTALWTQSLTLRETTRRERAARHDTFRVEQIQANRDTLIELQDAVEDYLVAWIHQVVNAPVRVEEGRPTEAAMAVKRLKVIKLAARLGDERVSAAVNGFLLKCRDVAKSSDDDGARAEEINSHYREVQYVIGDIISHDPFA